VGCNGVEVEPLGQKMQEMRRGCHIHLVVSPFCLWDTQRLILKTDGILISKQADTVVVEAITWRGKMFCNFLAMVEA
jgi:hypothetical protein